MDQAVLIDYRGEAAVRKWMIKKKIICTSIVLSVAILSNLYSTPKDDPYEDPNKKEHIAFIESKIEEKRRNALEIYTFANESAPLDNKNVKQKLDKYLSRLSYDSLKSYKLHRSADKYLPKIAEILASYGIPEDFKYIPLVESGLNPQTTSHKGAGGYWQFMPATARLYGLKVNGNVDERKDFIKSTHAAARYIKNLYEEFGDWTLVAAAYNVGGGRLKSSMRRQKEDNYYNLKLNSETGAYVYKLISMKEVIEKPEKYGYEDVL